MNVPLHLQMQRQRRTSKRWAILVSSLPLAVALLLRVASGPTASASYIVLAVIAMFGRAQAIMALTFSWLFTMLNLEIVAEGNDGGVGRYLVIFAAAASALYHRGAVATFKPTPEFKATAALFLFLIAHSILFSFHPDVSILKALSWGMAMISLISLWQGLSDAERDETAQKVYVVLIAVFAFSLPYLNHPAGVAVNGTGFQGILNHPQPFGITMALLGIWAGGRVLSRERPNWFTVLLMCGCFAMVLSSEARTGAVAMVLGLGLSLVMTPRFAGKSLLEVAPALRSWRIWIFVFLGLAAVLLMSTAFLEFVDQFLSKSGRDDSRGFWDAYDKSRGGLMAPMIANIAEDPFKGIGFGVASNPAMMDVVRDPLLGLPVGGAIEKGTAPLAIMEELGLTGAALVILWLRSLLRRGAISGLAPFAVCLTALLLNMGEYTLFSIGGQGLIVMVLFGWVFAGGQSRLEGNTKLPSVSVKATRIPRS